MKADDLLTALNEHGFRLFSGVPCSYLTPLINAVIDSPTIRYVNAANEGEAVAICSGAELGGVRSVVMFQNSGLGNAFSPLTSLNAIMRIPVLVIVTWRGRPDKEEDEPQHELVGRIMPELLDLIEMPYADLPTNSQDLARVLSRAVDSMNTTGLPFALLLPKGAVEERALASPPPPRIVGAAPIASRPAKAVDADEALEAIAQGALQADAAVLATTGFTGRALYRLGDRPNQLYMVGSMGCVSSLGLGLALARPDRSVVVIDGDGSLLMRMGALAAIGAQAPKNLFHIVLDNGVHDSTGAQESLANSVDIPAVAAACGYRRLEAPETVEELRALASAPGEMLRMAYVRTQPRADRRLPRPTITPARVARRFQAWLESTSRSR